MRFVALVAVQQYLLLLSWDSLCFGVYEMCTPTATVESPLVLAKGVDSAPAAGIGILFGLILKIEHRSMSHPLAFHRDH